MGRTAYFLGQILMVNSRGGGTRTPGLRFWRPPLYQLSYAPGSDGIVPSGFGHSGAMTDRTQEDMDRTQREREADSDELLDGQEGKRDGDEKGEREDAPPGE